MLSIIIGALLGRLLFFYFVRRPDPIEIVAAWLVGAVAGAAMGVFVADSLEHHEVELLRTPLAAMRNQTGLSGQFVLGSGNIDTLSSYRFLKQESDGGVTPAQVNADSLVRIYEDGNLQQTGYLAEIYSVCSKGSAWDWFALGGRRFVRFEFHVPRGTVVHQFKVD